MKIEDDSLAPYIIKIDKSNYEVYKKYKPIRKDKTEAPICERYVSTHPSLHGAILKVVNLKVESNKDTKDLKAFLRELRIIKTELLKITHDNLEDRLLKIESGQRDILAEIAKMKDKSNFEVDVQL